MSAQGRFFMMSSVEGADYLARITPTGKNGHKNVLLTALSGATPEQRKDMLRDDFVKFFLATCNSIFKTTGANYSSLQSPNHADSIACAWYDRENDRIIPAAYRIQELLRKAHVEHKLPTYYSVAADNLAAFMQITFADEDEIVQDPKVGFHEAGDDRLLRAGRLIAGTLPFEAPLTFELPVDSPVVGQ